MDEAEVRFGGILVRFERGHCVLQDAHDASRWVFVEEADVEDLILALYSHFPKVQHALHVEKQL